MPKPLISSESVAAVLKAQKLGVEVFTEFPSDMENVRYGVYIDDPATQDRSPYQLGVRRCGDIYIASDGMRIIVVTYQGDNKRDRIVEAIEDLCNDPIMDGYHERDYVQDEQYMNRAEYRTYDFTLKRLEFSDYNHTTKGNNRGTNCSKHSGS